MPKSVKTTAKKAPTKSKKIAPKSRTAKTQTEKGGTHGKGVMWKILKQKDELHKLHDQKQSETHVRMHEHNQATATQTSGGFSRFAGPRRKAA